MPRRIAPTRTLDKLSVSQLRQPELTQKILALKAKDRRRILARKAEFVRIVCPACAHDRDEESFRKEGFRFASCPACGTLYVNPRPTVALLAEHYRQAEANRFFVENVFAATETVRRERIFVPRARQLVELCRRHGVDGGVLADVGAGFGTFCEAMSALHFFTRVIAVELSPNSARACREKGLETLETPIEEANLARINVITAFELLEHLFAPQDFLAGCRRALQPGGMLVLTVPNIRGFDLLMLGKKSLNISGPSHLNYFHEASLRKLVTDGGFEVIETLTPGKLDAEIVRNAAIAGEINLADQPFLQHVLLDACEEQGAAFQDFLANHGLSSHLWLVARRQASGPA